VEGKEKWHVKKLSPVLEEYWIGLRRTRPRLLLVANAGLR
jgi:hypothetical protein